MLLKDGSHSLMVASSFSRNTIMDSLKVIVDEKSSKVFATWYDAKGNPTDEYSFGRLWEESGRIAHMLNRQWKVKKGDRVVLCYSFGLHFLAVFLGCLRAGVVAVLVYPPGPPLVKSVPKLAKVVEDCSPAAVLMDSKIALLRRVDISNPFSKTSKIWPSRVKFHVTDKNTKLRKTPEYQDSTAISPSDLAFLQYTSGSTGDPKGVMVTFDALRAQVNMIHTFWRRWLEKKRVWIQDEWSSCTWLPQYHDMGLVYALVAPLLMGGRVHLISPLDFIRKPLLWLEMMGRHRVRWSIAPDFAYRLVARRFQEALSRGEQDPIPGLDLSNLVALGNAAEPIRHDTRELFTDSFSKYGLREDWFSPGYGLAEHVAYASSVVGCSLSSPSNHKDCKFAEYVAVGSRDWFHESVTVKIVDGDAAKEVADGIIGEVWISSPSVATGYWGRPSLSRDTFAATLDNTQQENDNRTFSYLRTGDLGFFQDDKLYICGRIKDIVIVNGVNYYPTDIEYAVQEATSAVRPGCVAAFSSNETGGPLEIVFEVRRNHEEQTREVCSMINSLSLDRQDCGHPE